MFRATVEVREVVEFLRSRDGRGLVSERSRNLHMLCVNQAD